jgi:AcrR family transcriptional regulator
MARPRSQDKRNTLLAAATKVFANKGLSASTASITSEAGLAEGTLFIYFKGKDDLINTLYEELKLDLAESMLSELPKSATVEVRTRHIWNNFVEWGVKNPDSLSLLNKIKVWEGLRPEVRDETAARFAELHQMTENAIKSGVFNDIPPDFFAAMLTGQAETTMQFMRKYPANSEMYRDKGFEIFWNGITRK